MSVLLHFMIKKPLKLAAGVVRAKSVPQDHTSVANRVFNKEVRTEVWYCDPVTP